MNTYHNTDDNLKDDLISSGFDPALFHPDWRTKYPHGLMSFDEPTRMAAIEEWQSRNGEADWLCFDDSNFTDDARLIVVDFDSGITTKDFTKAGQKWGLSSVLIF